MSMSKSNVLRFYRTPVADRFAVLVESMRERGLKPIRLKMTRQDIRALNLEGTQNGQQIRVLASEELLAELKNAPVTEHRFMSIPIQVVS